MGGSWIYLHFIFYLMLTPGLLFFSINLIFELNISVEITILVPLISIIFTFFNSLIVLIIIFNIFPFSKPSSIDTIFPNLCRRGSAAGKEGKRISARTPWGKIQCTTYVITRVGCVLCHLKIWVHSWAQRLQNSSMHCCHTRSTPFGPVASLFFLIFKICNFALAIDISLTRSTHSSHTN